MCDTTVEDIEMRIKSLTDEGVILGYKAMVNWEKTSVEAVEALIEVKITPQRDKGFDRIAQRIYQYEEVESCYLMSGGYDLTVILTGRTLREVALFVSQKLSTIEGVTSTATHFILKKYKQSNVVFIPKEEQKRKAGIFCMIDLQFVISQRVQDIKPSGIRKFFDILENMTDAISLGVGSRISHPLAYP